MVFEPEAIARLRKRRKPVTPIEPPEPELPEFEPETIARMRMGRPPIPPPVKLELPELFKRVYPEFDFETEQGEITLDIMLRWVEEDPNAFIADIQARGRTPETIALLEALEATPEEIERVFFEPEPLEIPAGGMSFVEEVEGVKRLYTISEDYLVEVDGEVIGVYRPETGQISPQVVAPLDGIRQLLTIDTDTMRAYNQQGNWVGTYDYVTQEFTKLPEESKAKDIWDAFYLGGQNLYQQSKQFVVSALPESIFGDVSPKFRELYGDELADNVDEKQQEIRDKFRQVYSHNQDEWEEWVTKHPELAPRPEWRRGVFDDPSVIKDPAYWLYEFASTVPFMIAIMGTTVGVTAATGNPVLGVMAGMTAATVAQTQDIYETLLAHGATEDQAGDMALPIGVLVSGIEVIGDMPYLRQAFPRIFKLFTKEMGEQLAKRTVAELVKKKLRLAGTVWITETLEEVAQEATINAGIKVIDENHSLIEGLDETAVRAAIAMTPFALGVGALGGGMSLQRVSPSQTTDLTDAQMETKGWQKDPETGNWYQPLELPAGVEPREAPTVPVIPEEVVEVTPETLREMSVGELQRQAESPFRKKSELFVEELKRRVLEAVPRSPEQVLAMTRDEFIDRNADLVVEAKGRWGTVHYELKTQVGDYQKVWQVVGDTSQDTLGKLYDRFVEAKEVIPEVEVAKPPGVKEPEVPEVIGEGGIPVPPEEPIPQGVIDNNDILRNIGWKEAARPTRKVFERLGLFRLHKGIQRAEVEIGEERVARQKEQREVMKSVGKDKDRWALIFDEVNEKGSVVGLTFNEKRAVTYIRNWANEWAERKNLPADKRIKDYIPHLFEQEMIEQARETGQIPPELAMILSEKVAKKITDPFLKERLGAVGFLKDPFRAMEAYDAAALKVLYYEPFLQKIASIANDPAQRSDVRDYMKDYSRRMTGEPNKHDLKINADLQELAAKLEKVPGGKALAKFLSQGNPSGLAAYQFTGAIYAMWLGFKPTSAIRNLSQHTLIIGEVGPVHFADALRLRFTKEGKAMLKKSLVLRSRKAAFVPGIDDSFAEKWTDQFRETALWMFRYADKQNVSDAFLAGYSEAKSLLPDADEQVWIDRGDEVAADTQYLYTKMNSMAVSQSAPGRVFSILTTWSENWVELMSKWIARRPSQVYLEYEKATGEKVAGANWSTSVKAILMYMVIIGLGYALKEETRLKAWEYTGITSIRYLADVASGDFPGLQYIGAAANIIAGFATDDERRLNEGLRELNPAKMVGIIRQLNAVASGEKDWLTLLLYLEGRDWKLKKLKNEWKKDFEPYNELAQKDRKEYRENNPKIEAKLFITSQFTTLSSDAARAEVLRLIEAHDLDVEMIDGYEKVFGVDTAVELDKFQNRVGNLEKLEVGVEAEYYTMNDFASEVNTLVRNQGRTKVEQDGNQLAVEYLRAKDLFVQYDSLGTSDARKQHRLQFPDVEASLYLWGRISAFLNPNSAVELLRLMKKYDIPPEGIKAFVDDPAKYDALQAPLFQLQLEWNDMLVEYEGADDERKAEMLLDTAFRDAIRHIEAINKGIPPKQIDNYIAYYAKPIEGYDQERFLQTESLKPEPNYYTEVWLGILGNEEKDFSKVPTVEFENFFNDTYMGTEIGDARYELRVNNLWFDEEGVRLGKWKPWDARYEGMPPELVQLKKTWDNKISEYNLADDVKQETMLLDTKFRDAKRRIEAYDKEIPTALHDVYVGYYAIPSAGYENERYLMEHMGLVDSMVALGYWEPKDFSNVPTKRFEDTLPEYEKLPVGSARYEFRGNNRWFDEEGERLGKWKLYGTPRAKPKPEEVEEGLKEIEEMEEKLKRLRKTPPPEIEEDADKYLDEFTPEEVLDAVNALPEDIMVGTKENYGIPLDASVEDLTERQVRDLAGFLYFTGPQGQWGKRMAGYLGDADNLGLLADLDIPRNINPQHLTFDEVGRLITAVEVAHKKELIVYMKPKLDEATNEWLEKWGVPEAERVGWKNHLVTLDPTVLYAGGYIHVEGFEDLIKPEIRLHPDYIKAGVIAHEFAHANYFQHIPDSMLKYYPVAHALAQAISPMYVEAIKKYPGGKERGRLPVEGYAEAYRRLAEGKEQLPWYLEPFYGNLLFEIPDLPKDWEKSALAWLAYWMKYKLNIK